MILECKINLATCSTEALFKLKDSIDIAASQRMKSLRKRARSGGKDTFSEFETNLLEIESTYTTAPYV